MLAHRLLSAQPEPPQDAVARLLERAMENSPKLARRLARSYPSGANVLPAMEPSPRLATKVGGELPVARLCRGYTWVDTAPAIAAVLSELQREAESGGSAGLMVGMDTEWGDTLDGPAVIQLAIGDVPSEERCWVIDVARSSSRTESDARTAAATALLHWVFGATAVTVLGFAFGADIARLAHLAPGLPERRLDGRAAVVDLQREAVQRSAWWR